MGTSAFLTLLVCVHFVVGSPKSCPDADKPVEVIAMEIGSNEEAVSILGCDSVSVEKGNELMKSRFKNHNGEVAKDYYLRKAEPSVKNKYLGKDAECDSDCEATKTQVTDGISKVQQETESKMDTEIEKTERESAARRTFKEQMVEADEIYQQVKGRSINKQVALDKIEELQRKSNKAIIDDPNFSDAERNALLRSMNEGMDVYKTDLKTDPKDIARARNEKDCTSKQVNGYWTGKSCKAKSSVSLSDSVKKGEIHK